MVLAAGFAACGRPEAEPTIAAPPASPLRIAILSTPGAGCAAPGAESEAGARAYAEHLSKRLERPVLLCPAPDRAAAATLLAQAEADLAMLDAASFAVASEAARPFLTPRGFEGRGRVETVVATLAASPATGLADIAALRLVVAGEGALQLEEPRRALASHGLAADVLARAPNVATPLDGAQALRTGQADAMALYSAGWQRLCRTSTEAEAPCKDLKELWRGRPVPELVMAVRKDIDADTRFRLVGVLVALHLEAPEAMAWIAPGAPALDPVEADAFAGGGAP
jgi:ABC-type phosphate/phosphonate transport system substrate-binding protein